MRKYFISLSCIFFTLCLCAQVVEDDTYYNGKVVLADNSVLVGEVGFRFVDDMVLLKTDNQVRTFNAKQVFFLQFSDEEDSQRFIFSFPIQNNTGYYRNRLFELLYEGDLSLYTRYEQFMATRPLSGNPRDLSANERMRMNEMGTNHNSLTQFGIQHQINHDFYIAYPNAKSLSALSKNNYRDFHFAFKGYEKDIQKYRKRNKLDIKTKQHVLMMVHYYNSLLKEEQENNASVN